MEVSSGLFFPAVGSFISLHIDAVKPAKVQEYNRFDAVLQTLSADRKRSAILGLTPRTAPHISAAPTARDVRKNVAEHLQRKGF